MKTGEKDMHNQWNGNLPGTKPVYLRSESGRVGIGWSGRDSMWEMIGTNARCHRS